MKRILCLLTAITACAFTNAQDWDYIDSLNRAFEEKLNSRLEQQFKEGVEQAMEALCGPAFERQILGLHGPTGFWRYSTNRAGKRCGRYEEFKYQEGKTSWIGGKLVTEAPNQNEIRLVESGYYDNDEKTGLWQEFDENGNLKESITYANGVKEGENIEFYADGVSIKNRGDYLNGKQNGIWRGYYPSGKLKWETGFNEGLFEGKNVDYWENGQIKASGVYRNDAKDGVWIDRDEEGRITSRASYSEGFGSMIGYYPESGVVKVEGSWSDGKLHGQAKNYHPNGQLSMIREFEFGELLSKSCWDEKGTVIDCDD